MTESARPPSAEPRRTKRKKSPVAWVFVLGAVAIITIVVATERRVSIAWVQDYDQGVAQARREGKPLLLAFVGDTTFCRLMERDCYSNAAVVDFVERFVPVLIDGESRRDLKLLYRINTYPTYVIKWPDREQDERIVAHSSPAAFVQQLQRALDRIGPRPE
jgi:hypothetical protein